MQKTDSERVRSTTTASISWHFLKPLGILECACVAWSWQACALHSGSVPLQGRLHLARKPWLWYVVQTSSLHWRRTVKTYKYMFMFFFYVFLVGHKSSLWSERRLWWHVWSVLTMFWRHKVLLWLNFFYVFPKKLCTDALWMQSHWLMLFITENIWQCMNGNLLCNGCHERDKLRLNLCPIC